MWEGDAGEGADANALRPYPTYLDSGLEWLREVPKHWRLVRAKNLLMCIDVRSVRGDEELLTVSSDRGVVPRASTSVTMFKAESYVGHKLCWPGDLVINSLWAWSRGLGVSKFHGIVSTAYGVYRPRPHAQISSAYVHRLVRSSAFRWELRVRSKGVWISRLQLTDDAFLEAPFPLPPLPEQNAITRFLDHADHRIQRYIRAKEKLVELLAEQKQAIINRAVTGRVDVCTGKPYPAYRDSGVEWLGEVPEHWEVRRLGRAGRFFKGSGGSKADETERGVPCIRYGDLYTRHQFHITGSKTCVALHRAPAYTPVRYGDVLFAGSGETLEEIGKSAVNLIAAPVVCGGDVIVFRSTIDVDAKFLGWSADSRTTAVQKARMGRGITVMHIYSGNLKYLAVPLPPLPEQAAIARYLDHATADIHRKAELTRRQIGLAEEYRTRLISDVVTGKLDVRAAAEALPDGLDHHGILRNHEER